MRHLRAAALRRVLLALLLSVSAGSLLGAPASAADFGDIRIVDNGPALVRVGLDTPATFSWTVTNIGTDAVRLEDGGFSYSVSPPFALTSPLPVDLGPGDSTVVTTSFPGAATVGRRDQHMQFRTTPFSSDIPYIDFAADVVDAPVAVLSSGGAALGDIDLGVPRSFPVSVQNRGSKPLVFGAMTPSGPEVSVSPAAPGPLAPGATQQFQVTLTPGTPGPGTASVAFAFGGGTVVQSNLTRYALSYQAVGPRLAVDDPATISGLTGAAQTGEVVLRNTGNRPLQIDGLSLASSAGGAFLLAAPPVGQSIAPGGSLRVAVRFGAVAAGTYDSVLTVSTDDPARPSVDVGITGVKIAPAFTVDPPTVDFGDAAVGEPVTRTITVANTTTAPPPGYPALTPISLLPLFLSGDASFGAPASVDASAFGSGTTRELTVTWRPAQVGPATGTALVRIRDADGTVRPGVLVSLKGVARGPELTAPAAVDFGTLTAGGPPVTRDVTIRNTGLGLLSVSGVTVAGTGFASGDASGAFTLAAGAERTLHVVFDPAVRGAATGTLTITSDGSASPLLIDLAAAVLPPPAPVATLSRTTVAFGEVRVGASATQTVTVRNDGTADLRFGTLAITGSARFTVIGDTSPLAPGLARTFTVKLAPTARGTVSGTLSIPTDAGPALSVGLTGKGVAPEACLGTTTAAFGAAARGTAPTKTVTVVNNGDAPLSFSAIQITGTDAGRFTITGASTPIAPGAARVFIVAFVPTAAGARSATLRFATDSVIAVPTVALSGTATAPVAKLAIDTTTAKLLTSLSITTGPIAPATGTAPFTLPISGGKVNAAGAGSLTGTGGLEFKKGSTTSRWTAITVDLTRRVLTAQVGSTRVDIATLTAVTTASGFGDTLKVNATVSLTTQGAALLSTLSGKAKSVAAGTKLGTITVDAPKS